MQITAKDIGIKASAGGTGDPKKEDKEVQKWTTELSDARKREKEWRKEAVGIVELYEGGKKNAYQYNILYSNTETMLPALYNSSPSPIVERRFKDADPLGKMASTAGERTLQFLIDNGDPSYTDFDDLMQSAVLEALVPGRGLTRFKYDALLENVQNEQAAEQAEKTNPDAVPDEDEENDGDEAGKTDDTPPEPAVPTEKLKYETVCGEEVPWDRFLHGNAKKWNQVPWCAIEHFMTKEELEKNFGTIASEIPVTEMSEGMLEIDDAPTAARKEELKGMKVAQVFEIWDKDEKEVLFICPAYKKGVLKKVPDPLGLSGFYPWPQPLTFTSKISTLVPVALYTMYEEQAKELNRITTRINKITNALKVRGMYDGTVEGLDKVLTAEDNILIPVENVAALYSQGNALEKAIWLMPIDKLVTVLQQLYTNRQQIKTVIYEITGIADIMRGSSMASETLGAQKIKNQWGTLRLKKAQKMVAKYCRACMRIVLEIAMSKFSPETLKSITGLPFPLQSQKDQLRQQVAQVTGQIQQRQAVAQVNGQPPPPVPPEVQQQLQQAQKQLQVPSWEDLQALLQNDLARSYRIDIETNSTVDAEATEDKEDISELLNAISQFLNGVGPLVQGGALPAKAAQGMLQAVVRRYRFGPEFEDALNEMVDPKANQQPNPEQLKQQQADLQKQADAIKQQAEQLQQQKVKNDQAQSTASMQLDFERKQFEMEKQFAQQEAGMRQQFAIKELELQQTAAENAIRASSQVEVLKVAGKAQAVRAKTQNAKQPQVTKS